MIVPIILAIIAILFLSTSRFKQRRMIREQQEYLTEHGFIEDDAEETKTHS